MFAVSDVGLVVVTFEAVGYCLSMGDVGVRLFAVSWWCGIKWSHTLNCWMVLSGKLSFCIYSCVLNGWVSLP